jgi:hypothetical protein
MAQRSSIDRLPPDVRERVDAAIKNGATIDEIVGMLLDLHEAGALAEPVSRSAVGRYSKNYREIAAQQRELQSVAKAMGREFGEEGDLQGRLLIQLATSIATRAIMPIAAGEDVEMDGKELHFLARAIKDITSAAKTDVDREAKIRDEAVKRTKAAAAEAAASSARGAGASEETIRTVRAAILGIEP